MKGWAAAVLYACHHHDNLSQQAPLFCTENGKKITLTVKKINDSKWLHWIKLWDAYLHDNNPKDNHFTKDIKNLSE